MFQNDISLDITQTWVGVKYARRGTFAGESLLHTDAFARRVTFER